MNKDMARWIEEAAKASYQRKKLFGMPEWEHLSDRSRSNLVNGSKNLVIDLLKIAAADGVKLTPGDPTSPMIASGIATRQEFSRIDRIWLGMFTAAPNYLDDDA